MPQITQCPHCRGQLQVRDENLGQTIRCPLCNGLFRVAAPQAPPPPVVNVEVVEPPAPPSPPPPPPPSPPLKPKPSGAVRKPAPKPSQKARPTPPPAEAEAERPRRRKTPAPPAPAEEDNPFALGGPLGGAVGGGPAALNFEEGEPKAHRGTTVLVLGLLGWFLSCCPLVGYVLGGAAIQMGNRDLRLMSRNRMDRAGKGLTIAGKILGIVAMVTNTLSLIAWVWQIVGFFTGRRF
jgi:predicted Zn finger-like uncharacterized protein